MASSLRRLATNSGKAYRSALVPFPRASSLHSKLPSNSFVSQFLRRALCTATPEVPGTSTGSPDAVGSEYDSLDSLGIGSAIDLEASIAARAAFTKARMEKLERIADEVMGLSKVEYKDYSAILRDKLCRGEKSLFDVKIEKFEPEKKLDVIRAMLDFADELDLQRISDMLDGAPSVVKKMVPKEEAEKIVEVLKEAGATAVVE